MFLVVCVCVCVRGGGGGCRFDACPQQWIHFLDSLGVGQLEEELAAALEELSPEDMPRKPPSKVDNLAETAPSLTNPQSSHTPDTEPDASDAIMQGDTMAVPR